MGRVWWCTPVNPVFVRLRQRILRLTPGPGFHPQLKKKKTQNRSSRWHPWLHLPCLGSPLLHIPSSVAMSFIFQWDRVLQGWEGDSCNQLAPLPKVLGG